MIYRSRLSFLLLLVLVGCGQTGPLFLPSEKSQVTQ